VLVVEVGREVRAYPLGILTQHEIANDVIDGVPVAVTYCPLCNSGLAFDRRVNGEVLTFGTSGRLFQSNLVMYDRQHRNLWSQFNGTALLGWGEYKRLAPHGLVLSPDINPNRDYNRNPYPNYDDVGIGFGLFEGPQDGTLPATTVSVCWAPGVSSALDRAVLDEGREVGQVTSVVPISGDGRVLHFAPSPDDPARFVDRETGSTWTLLARRSKGN
jgi:hypothetical protein